LWLTCDAGSDEHTLETNLPSTGQRGFEEDGNSIVWLWRLSMSGYVDAGKEELTAFNDTPDSSRPRLVHRPGAALLATLGDDPDAVYRPASQLGLRVGLCAR
jgi:hypothetical protein